MSRSSSMELPHSFGSSWRPQAGAFNAATGTGAETVLSECSLRREMGVLCSRCRRRIPTPSRYLTEAGFSQADGTSPRQSWSSTDPYRDSGGQPWKAYADRDHEFVPPSTARERRRRGVTTRSLPEKDLQEMAEDSGWPRRAEHAARELARRRAEEQ